MEKIILARFKARYNSDIYQITMPASFKGQAITQRDLDALNAHWEDEKWGMQDQLAQDIYWDFYVNLGSRILELYQGELGRLFHGAADLQRYFSLLCEGSFQDRMLKSSYQTSIINALISHLDPEAPDPHELGRILDRSYRKHPEVSLVDFRFQV